MISRTGLASLKGNTLVAAIVSVCSSGFLLFGMCLNSVSQIPKAVQDDDWMIAGQYILTTDRL